MLPPILAIEHMTDSTAESLIDQALACNAIGGVHDRQTPTVFISLLLKLLQIQPEKEILFEYLLAEEFKLARISSFGKHS